MTSYTTKKIFNHPLATGAAALILSFIVASIIWPIWSLLVQKCYLSIAGAGLANIDPNLVKKLLKVVAEGTFFWMAINSWIWLTLTLGNYGKNHFTTKQPWAGIWYTFCAWALGIFAFLLLISFLGIWWHPFSLSLMFTPSSPHDVHLAIEAWEASNFYALTVIIAQIPLISLFQKWPFAGKAKQPIDSFGVLAIGIAVTWIIWMAMIVPSWMKLSLDGQVIVSVPFGSWPAFIAFCQAYVIFAIMPVEGAELYPMKLFAKKQPLMGLIGFIIAIAAGFIIPPILKDIIAPFNLVSGAPLDVVVASLELSIIVFMLAWHHLFDDFPSPKTVTNNALRIWTRITIWFVGGGIFGVIWLKTFQLIPFGANNLGIGVTPLGMLAGQFALLMTFLFMNTFFDKWPLVRQVKDEK